MELDLLCDVIQRLIQQQATEIDYVWNYLQLNLNHFSNSTQD
jgi:hypothetical protein